MKIYHPFLIALLVIGVQACSSGEANKSEPASNTNTTPEMSENPDNRVDEEEPELQEAPVELSPDAKASRSQVEAKDAAETGLGPTDTLRAFYDATIKKDAPKIKSLISRASMKLVEDAAKAQGTSVDQILTADDDSPKPVEREFRNEVVDGNNATVEEKNVVFGRYDKIFLVKEDGNWRVALDKIQAEMIRKLNEMQKNAPNPIN